MALGVSALGPVPQAGRTDQGSSAPAVRTDSGRVRGVATAEADQFLGLPYAAPPLRELRFAPPAAPAAWTGLHQADRRSPACLQFEPTGIREEQAVSEDCLYLEVHRPSHGSKSAKPGAPAWPLYGTGQKVMQLRTGGASQVITTYVAEHHATSGSADADRRTSAFPHLLVPTGSRER